MKEGLSEKGVGGYKKREEEKEEQGGGELGQKAAENGKQVEFKAMVAVVVV